MLKLLICSVSQLQKFCRYTGEENNSAHAESDKLRKVLKNIEKRKKQRKQRKLAAALNEVIKENNAETLNVEQINTLTADNEPINEDTDIPRVPEKVDKHEKKLENIEGFTVLNSEQYNKKQIVSVHVVVLYIFFQILHIAKSNNCQGRIRSF